MCHMRCEVLGTQYLGFTVLTGMVVFPCGQYFLVARPAFSILHGQNAAGTEWDPKMFLKNISVRVSLGCLRTESIQTCLV